MTNRKLLLCLLVIAAVIAYSEALLESALRKFETLHHDSFRHHVSRRDLYSQHPEQRQVEYDSYGRHFHLVLHRISAPLYTSNLKIFAIDEHNNERLVDFEPVIYHGYLADEPDTSSVSAYWEDDDTLTAAINTSSAVYVIEPSWRHLPNSSNFSMISYRDSDVKMDDDIGKSFCGYARPPGSSDNQTLEVDDDASHQPDSRVKRQASCATNGRSTCTLLLVADFRFYKNMGLGSTAKTTSYLLLQIDRINNIFKDHSFGSCGSGFGFEIKEIRIHERASTVPAYNMDKSNWETTDLLESFSTNATNQEFCLAHLFTAIPFQSGTLGLSYVAAASVQYPGGLCSRSYEDKNKKQTLYLNTGWSSSLNRYKRRLLTLEATLVTAHEFGHNWGSEHDPDSTECSPSSARGGKYIMYTYSVSGIDSNNKIFSPCSLRSVGAVLRSKASTCFRAPSGSFCGNSLVENNEECDVGAGRGDKCCNAQCKLKPDKQCSDANEVCCEDCRYAPSTKVCALTQESLCVGNATCSGNSTLCMPAPQKPNGTICRDSGRCSNGHCVSICEYHNKESCVCDSVEYSCMWCCRSKSDVNKTCRPYSRNLYLPDGMPCLQGSCFQGVCKKQVSDTIQRLWDIIENITVDRLVMFMRANIVGTVIILSLIIWIPASCIVACIDRQRDKEQKEYTAWLDNRNNDLVRENERSQLTIRRANKLKVRRAAKQLDPLYIPQR